MSNNINTVLLGMINQHQFWINHKREDEASGLAQPESEAQKTNVKIHSHSSGAVYGLGLIGGAIYLINHSNSTRQKLLGILKAIIWPAFLVYKMLEFLDNQ